MTDRTDAPKKYTGFLHLKCAHCGEIKSFCAKTPVGRYMCSFGHYTDLGELRGIRFRCECGKIYKYMTNLDDTVITMSCFGCGSPVDLEWNPRKQQYERM